MPPPTSGFAPPFGGPSVPSSPAFAGSGGAKKSGLFKFASGINLLWVILVGVLAGFVIDVRTKCDSKDRDSYESGTHTVFVISIVVLMIVALILLYELNHYIQEGKK